MGYRLRRTDTRPIGSVALPLQPFVPVAVGSAPATILEVLIELRLGAAAVTLLRPLQAAQSFAAWLKDRLR